MSILGWPDLPLNAIIPTPPVPGTGLPPQGIHTYSCAYTSKKNSGNQAYTLNPVEYFPQAQAERHPTFGVYTKIEMDVVIPQILLTNAGLTPKPGDFFTGPDSNTYNVVGWETQGVFKVCVTGFDPILSYQLTDTINILPPVDSTDIYASPITTQGAPGSNANLAARIQFDKEETVDYQGVQYMRAYYKIYVQNLDDNLAIGTTVKAISGEYNGTTFRVISNENIEQLEELEMLTVTVDP